MANSSEWVARIGNSAPPPPQWLAALDVRDGFSPASPFAAGETRSPLADHPHPEQPAKADEDLIAKARAEGEAAGRAQAWAEAQAEIEAQRSLRLAFRNLDQQALDALAADLSETVVTLCAQVIDARAIDRETLTTQCREAARRIGAAAGQCALRLHPDDLALINDADLGAMQITADPMLERGALVLVGPEGTVRDGPAEWRRAIAAALQP